MVKPEPDFDDDSFWHQLKVHCLWSWSWIYVAIKNVKRTIQEYKLEKKFEVFFLSNYNRKEQNKITIWMKK